MEQLIGSKLGKEYDKAVYCPPAYLTYTQNTSCGRQDWMNPKVELRQQCLEILAKYDSHLWVSSAWCHALNPL